MAKLAELREILKQNNLHGYSQYTKKKLIVVLKEKGLMPDEPPQPEKKEADPRYANLKGIGTNPKDVILKDIKTGEETSFPSIYKAAKFLGKSPRMITFWVGRVWNNKYEKKMKDQPPPHSANESKIYLKSRVKFLAETVEKIRDECIRNHGFDPMLYI